MIQNHAKAVDYIWHHPPKKNRLTLAYILRLHSFLTNNLGIKPGLRIKPVGISGSIYLPPSNPQIISLALEKTIQSINIIKHPVEKFVIAVAMLSYIQPFMDGMAHCPPHW
jgi:Fic family protein